MIFCLRRKIFQEIKKLSNGIIVSIKMQFNIILGDDDFEKFAVGHG